MAKSNLYKRGEIWWGRVHKNGRDFRKSLETGSKTVARDRFNRWKEELNGTAWGETPRRTFDDAVRRFIVEHLSTVKPSTAKRYQLSLSYLIDHFQALFLDEISAKNLSSFEMARRRSVKPPTIRRDLACLSTLFSCAEAWEWITSNPVRIYMHGRRKTLKENPPRGRFLTHQEEANLIAAANKWVENRLRKGITPLPWNVLIPLFIDTGLRKNEMLLLERERQLRLDRKEIFIPDKNSKSGCGRSVPILNRSLELIGTLPVIKGQAFVFFRGDGEPYSKQSPTIWASFKKIVKYAEIEDLTIHDLRRTCGCRLLQDRRMSMEEVSKWLGHSSVKVTEQIYAFLEVEHLHRAVKRTEGNSVTLPEEEQKARPIEFSNKSFTDHQKNMRSEQ